jgi:SAM-dependent methyltransferase
MAAGFKDHFSKQSPGYAAFRPRYPDALFSWLASLTPGHDLAWDAGTGNGQAAVSLAGHYARVIASDASGSQIAAGVPHQRVTYRVGRENESGLPDHSCDLVTVAQALHWFDAAAFFKEAKRVLKPGGAVAAWTYARPSVDDPRAGPIFDEYLLLMDPWWPPERVLVETGYRTIDFPFDEIAAPAMELEMHPLLEELAGYMRTWSAYQAYVAKLGGDPVVPFEQRLAAVWPAGERRRLFWPLAMRVGRVSATLPT